MMDDEMSLQLRPGEMGGVLIYIDNSNIWINTMQHSARKLDFINDIQQDHRIRVSINKLITIASGGRPIIRCVLYGSEPPPVKKFWNNVKECKLCNVEVQVTKRSTFNNKEREVDQSINLDIGEDIVIHREHTKYNGTVILFTGDGGMTSAVKRAIKYNWNVEIWAYDKSLARVYRELIKELQDKEVDTEKFKICLLDDHFDELVYYALEWKNLVLPPERSFVITLKNLYQNTRKDALKTFVEAATLLFRLPMSGRFIYYPKNVSETHLALICNVNSEIMKEDSRCDTINKSVWEQNNKHNETAFHFTQDQWIKIVELMMPTASYGNETENIRRSLEAIMKDVFHSKIFDNKNLLKYDFNKDVYQKAECYLLSRDYFNAEENPMKNMILKHRPVLRSVPQFLQDMRSYNISDIHFEAPALQDPGEDGFQVVCSKRIIKKCQKYSDPCNYGFRCNKGFKCIFAHSDKEAEFFKLQTDPKLRTTYKFKECDHYNKQRCRFTGSLSYMCPFSHGIYCQECKCDDDGGHEVSKCPSIAREIQP